MIWSCIVEFIALHKIQPNLQQRVRIYPIYIARIMMIKYFTRGVYMLAQASTYCITVLSRFNDELIYNNIMRCLCTYYYSFVLVDKNIDCFLMHTLSFIDSQHTQHSLWSPRYSSIILIAFVEEFTHTDMLDMTIRILNCLYFFVGGRLDMTISLSNIKLAVFFFTRNKSKFTEVG
ncbi:hypothetical protein ACJX0J_008835 [Zea mays]